MGEAIFPRWIDKARPLLGAGLVLAPVYLVAVAYYGGSPRTTTVGYMPQQSIPFSHALHAGELGIDCRYCHTTVETAAHAAIPSTATCMNCHEQIGATAESLRPLHESAATGEPIRWIRVHDLPDFVFFDHSAHVARGVSCVSCHGRVDRMEEVYHVETLSMSWCLDCHRNPEPHLRPLDQVTVLDWVPTEDPEVLGARLRPDLNIDPSTDCSTCHR